MDTASDAATWERPTASEAGRHQCAGGACGQRHRRRGHRPFAAGAARVSTGGDPATGAPVSGCVHTYPRNTTSVVPDSKTGSTTTCRDQTACLDIYYSNNCDFGVEMEGGSYTYCQVCLFWSGSSNCGKPLAANISHVCAGDEFLPVLPASGLAPVTGLTNKRSNWRAGIGSEAGPAV